MKQFTPALPGLTVALLAAALPWSASRADPPAPTGRVPYDGSQIFRRYILHDLCKLRPAHSLDEVFKDPRNSLVILLGDVRAANEVGITAKRLGKLWKRQGAVLIACDRRADNLLSEDLRITGAMVYQPAVESYRQQKECPLLKDYDIPRHPIFRGLTRGLATNKPSYLEGRSPALPALATFPRGCLLEAGAAAQPLAYIAGSSRAARAEDRVLIIAGNGLFINGMLAQRDSDNFAFACNCVGWLTNEGQRKQVLFVEEGTIQASFDVPIRELPPLPIPPTQVVEKILGRLEEEGFFDKLFDSSKILLLISGALLVYGVNRLLRARHRRQTNLPLLPEGLARADAQLAPMTQRHRDLVWAGNLWEAARALARSCFDHVGEPWQAHPAQPPVLEIAGGWARRLWLGRQVRSLWKLAHGPEAGPLSPRQYAQVAARVHEVQAALADGSLRFPHTPVDTLE
jgi:hypothetical protein